MQEDLEVTGISRSGRVRKKSSKLMDFESPDDIEARYKRQAAKYGTMREEPAAPPEFHDAPPPRPEEAATASEGESDYDMNGENPESMESDSSASEEGTPRPAGVANSLYMMEKSAKKKLIVKDGKVVGRAKAQRKDKGKTRITAYMMWAKEARNELLRKHPDMDFSAISKRLGEMWANVNYHERYSWKRRAKRFAMQKEQSNHSANKIISNQAPRTSHAGPGRPPTRAPQPRPQQTAPSTPQPSSGSGAAGSGWSSRGSFGGSGTGGARAGAGGSAATTGGCGAAELAAHLRLLGESLAIIGDRLKEHEGQIAVSGSVSVLLDTLLCALAPLLGVARAVPAIAPPARLLHDTLHNIAYIMPGL